MAVEHSTTAGPGWARGLALALGNGLTLGRLLLGLVFPWVPPGWRLTAVLAGALSDLCDGWVSRRGGASSTFGRVLDPVADKLFVIVVLATLCSAGEIPTWQVPLVAFRDVAVAGGSAWSVARRGLSAVTRMPPSWAGKAATGAQFVFLLVLLYDRGRGAGPAVRASAFAAAAALSVAAGVGYLRRSSGA